MPSVYAFGSSHSIGYNHKDWTASKRFASTCYPKVISDTVGGNLIHFGHVGIGVDYVSKQIVSNPFGAIKVDDIAVVQLYGIYGFKTLYEPKFNRTLAAVTQYASLDSKAFNVKINTTDDVQDFVDYMHHANTIVARCEQLFRKYAIFFCQPLKDKDAMFKRVEGFSQTERNVLDRFKYNLTHRIIPITFQEFSKQYEPRFSADGVHFNEEVHKNWANHLLSKM